MQRVQVQSENLSGDDIVRHLGKLIAGWSPRCLETKITHLLRLQSFLNEHVPGSTIHDDLSAVTMSKFFGMGVRAGYREGAQGRRHTRSAGLFRIPEFLSRALGI